MVRFKAFWLLLVLALVAAGCGDDDSEGDDPVASSPSAAEEEEPEVDPAADQKAADAAVAAVERRFQDAGFTETADDDDDELEFESPECRELESTFSRAEKLAGETATAESGDYELDAFEERGYSELVMAELLFVERAELARDVFELFETSPVEKCMEEALRLTMEKSGEEDGVQVTAEDIQVDVASSELGDEGLLIQFGGVFGAGGLQLPVDFVIEFVQVDRAVAFAMTGVIGDGQSSIDRRAVLEQLLEHAGAA